MHSADAIHFTDLSVSIDRCRLLDKVSLNIGRGEFVCVCGPNGAGKTVLLKSILGLLPSKAKSFAILGVSMSEPSTAHPVMRRVGYVPQRKTFDRAFPAKVVDMLVAAHRRSWPFFVSKSERELAAESLQTVGGASLIDKELRSLSGGEVQRCFLASALINKPEILFLDEPMAGVDRHGREEMGELFASFGGKMTVVMITHSDKVVRECATRVVYIEGGHVRASGTPEDLLAQRAFTESSLSGPDHEMAMSSFGEHAHHHHDED